MTTIRDRIWMYAALPDAYNDIFQLPGVSPYEPEEVCRNLGIRRVVVDVTRKGPYPFDDWSRKFADMDELVWTIVPSSGVKRNDDGFFDMEEGIRQIRKYPNVTGVFIDDFTADRREVLPPEKLAEMKRRVVAAAEGRKMDLWMVTYNWDITVGCCMGRPVWRWGDSVDIASFWTWQGYYLKVLPEHLDYLAGIWPGKRINLGIYLWNFGCSRPLEDEMMQFQLDTALKYFRLGRLEGLSLCSNCLFGIGVKAADIFQRWLDKYGDEEVETRDVRMAEAVHTQLA